MGQFHINFGNSLKEQGHNVVYALADRLPFYTEAITLENDKYYVFSDFFQENFDESTFDNKYHNININKLFFSDFDRNIIHQEMKALDQDLYEKLMINLVNFFDTIISENEINICVYESISNSFAYTAFEVLKVNGIPYCGYGGSRLKGRFELYTEEFGSTTRFENIFNNVELNNVSADIQLYVDEFLEQYRKATEMPTYHPKGTHLDWNHSIFKKYLDIDKVNLLLGSLEFLFKEYKSIKYSYMIGNPFLKLLKNFKLQLKKQVRIRYAHKYFDKNLKVEKYYIYPQHFKPESSTSVLARHYCDDVALIRNIAFNLPFGTKLYVKEHFVNFGKLSTKYYKELKKIPNVRLISHEENIQKLLVNSLGVITLTSTVGFEGLLYNKPVFVFGNVFYQCHPNCFKITSYDDLEKILKRNVIVVDQDVNRKFIVAYYRNTIKGNVYYNLSSEGFTQTNFNEQFLKAIDERFFN